MARDKFGHDTTNFRVVNINLGSPAQAAATGADRLIVMTVPVGAYWEILSIYQNSNTTATAGTRTPKLTITDPAGNLYFLRFSSIVATASQFLNLTWSSATEMTVATGGQTGNTSLPNALALPAGFKVNINLNGSVDAADPHIVNMLVKEYV